MHFILILLVSLPVFANRFSLPETGARFELVISPVLVGYSSESLKKKFPVVKCNEKLAQALNAELLSKLPPKEVSQGLKLQVDDREIIIDPKSDLGKIVLMMDTRILRFTVEEKEACK